MSGMFDHRGGGQNAQAVRVGKFLFVSEETGLTDMRREREQLLAVQVAPRSLPRESGGALRGVDLMPEAMVRDE